MEESIANLLLLQLIQALNLFNCCTASRIFAKASAQDTELPITRYGVDQEGRLSNGKPINVVLITRNLSKLLCAKGVAATRDDGENSPLQLRRLS